MTAETRPGRGGGRSDTVSAVSADTASAAKETIADRVYKSIRRDLMECRWPAGQTLKIRTLASEFGVSPMPVRIALKRLGDEGAIIVEENRSARVPVISQQRFSEFFELSVVLETLALEKASERISPEQIETLLERAEDIQRDIDDERTKGYAQRFNSILMDIYRHSGSSALIETIEFLWVRVAPPANAVFEAPMFIVKIHAHLFEILQALSRRDIETAKAALVAALSYSQRAMNLLMDMDETSKNLRKKSS